MLTKDVINSLYRKFNKRPSSPDELDIALLFEHLMDNHRVAIDEEANLLLGSVPPESPFRSIPLSNIHAIVEFADEVVIVLPSSLIILNKDDSQVYIHINSQEHSLSSRLGSFVSKLRANMVL